MVDRGAGVISVIMPAYNEERALPNTLRALFSQVGDYEVVIVDGGSTDGTYAVLAEFSFLEYPVPLTPAIDRTKRPRIPNECWSQAGHRRVAPFPSCRYARWIS